MEVEGADSTTETVVGVGRVTTGMAPMAAMGLVPVLAGMDHRLRRLSGNCHRIWLSRLLRTGLRRRRGCRLCRLMDTSRHRRSTMATVVGMEVGTVGSKEAMADSREVMVDSREGTVGSKGVMVEVGTGIRAVGTVEAVGSDGGTEWLDIVEAKVLTAACPLCDCQDEKTFWPVARVV